MLKISIFLGQDGSIQWPGLVEVILDRHGESLSAEKYNSVAKSCLESGPGHQEPVTE